MEDEWSKSFCLSEMAQILLSWGKPHEALQYNRKAEEILRPTQGEKHQNIGENLLARGTIYRAMGENDKAESCFLEAADIFRGVGLLKREAAAREQLFAKQ
ncbi:MAG: tetratricopeptide repeat protein [Clostridium sp.]|nr:tetratricopeptide repeat protein [Clostridium sp.]